MRKRTITPAEIISRSIAAIVGGFAVASSLGWAIASILNFANFPLAQAVHWGTIASFLFWAAAAMWAFVPATQQRMWLGLGTASAAALLVVSLLKMIQ